MYAAAVSGVRPEGTGVKVQVIGGVVAVDIRVFENVGFGAKYLKMADRAANDVGVTVAQCVSEALPIGIGVE